MRAAIGRRTVRRGAPPNTGRPRGRKRGWSHTSSLGGKNASHATSHLCGRIGVGACGFVLWPAERRGNGEHFRDGDGCKRRGGGGGHSDRDERGHRGRVQSEHERAGILLVPVAAAGKIYD